MSRNFNFNNLISGYFQQNFDKRYTEKPEDTNFKVKNATASRAQSSPRPQHSDANASTNYFKRIIN